ncbi:MAG: tubulin-like doman-containing protein [Pirellulaceae bacterium]|nr:tubulin-like doman-containing protein [Pirellulaceae bacterium]
MPNDSGKSQQTLLGYSLQARIGKGSQTEIWRAQSHGGSMRAIKLIWGLSDEKSTRLQIDQLNRLKELRHPFLLPLECVELVDDCLVLVSQLADKSLSDRFRECVEQGLPGIPRDELLAYLQDAADALDYVRETQATQHLNIKPENLLLVGEDAKVADFGIFAFDPVTGRPMMVESDLIYASPELQSGRPSIHSDQYSLAVVFYEMLTGATPFSKTPLGQAALDDPFLTAQLGGGQAVIRKALSRDPADRFGSSRHFISALRKSAGQLAYELKRNALPCGLWDANPKQAMASPDFVCVDATSENKVRELPPPPELEHKVVRPTLYIGIGETGTKVMRRLRHRLGQRFGERDELPALQMLCIDTDVQSLANAVQKGQDDSLIEDEILPVPLRTLEEYRDDSNVYLSWIDRQWICNIPSSLQTEGLRPLGRLAFVDHNEIIFERLHQLFDKMTLAESLAQTAETVELDPGSLESPRVFIVASISGGVGSGMVLDLTYAVRTVMLERGLNDNAVCGILTYAAGRTTPDRDLTVVNTVSCLNEMHHYSRATGFPGDDTCGLPSFDEEDGDTFSRTYVVDLGQNLVANDFDSAADHVADYVYLCSVTPCVSFFDACREQDDVTACMTVSSFGVRYSDLLEDRFTNLPFYQLKTSLIDTWLKTSVDGSLTFDGQQLLTQVEITVDTVLEQFEVALGERFGLSSDSIVEAEIQVLIHESSDVIAGKRSSSNLAQIEKRLSRLFDSSAADLTDQPTLSNSHRSFADLIVSQQASQTTVISKLATKVISHALNGPGQRIAKSRAVQRALVDHLESRHDEVMLLINQAESDCEAVREQLVLSEDDSNRDLSETSAAERAFAKLKLKIYLLKATGDVFIAVRDRCLAVAKTIDRFAEQLAELSNSNAKGHQQRVADLEFSTAGKGCSLPQLISKKNPAELDRLCWVADRIFQDEMTDGTLWQLVATSKDFSEQFESILDRVVKRVLSTDTRYANFESIINEVSSSAKEGAGRLQHEFEEATPPVLYTLGGATRLLTIVPQGVSIEQLDQTLRENLQQSTIVPNASGDLAFCCEVSQISLERLGTQLRQAHSHVTEDLARFHTRTDVNWISLI